MVVPAGVEVAVAVEVAVVVKVVLMVVEVVLMVVEVVLVVEVAFIVVLLVELQPIAATSRPTIRMMPIILCSNLFCIGLLLLFVFRYNLSIF